MKNELFHLSDSTSIALSNIFTALNEHTIGTKITDALPFFKSASESILNHDFSKDRVPGQGFIPCSAVIPYVSGGVGRQVNDTHAYVLRSYRGAVHAYLKRAYAEEVSECNLIVYTYQAYLDDPDSELVESARIQKLAPDYVLVALLATPKDCKPVLSPYRFVQNLAGGNNEALSWTADEIRAKAKDISDYTDEWSTVSD